ncbi:hypothetical protein [Desulfurella sp.]|nr:hypothetical protein [Desulfurella sp.]
MNNTDPGKIVNDVKENSRKFKENFMDFVRSLEKQGKAGSYIVRFKKH